MRRLKAVRSKSINWLAWISFAFAVLGGALAPAMWVGRFATTVLGFAPWPWLPPVLFGGAVLAIAVDLWIDFVPNQAAIAGAIFAPSAAASVNGELSAKVVQFSSWMLSWASAPFERWLGTGSSTGLAVGAIVAATIMARRVVKKAKGSKTAVTTAA